MVCHSLLGMRTRLLFAGLWQSLPDKQPTPGQGGGLGEGVLPAVDLANEAQQTTHVM